MFLFAIFTLWRSPSTSGLRPSTITIATKTSFSLFFVVSIYRNPFPLSLSLIRLIMGKKQQHVTSLISSLLCLSHLSRSFLFFLVFFVFFLSAWFASLGWWLLHITFFCINFLLSFPSSFSDSCFKYFGSLLQTGLILFFWNPTTFRCGGLQTQRLSRLFRLAADFVWFRLKTQFFCYFFPLVCSFSLSFSFFLSLCQNFHFPLGLPRICWKFFAAVGFLIDSFNWNRVNCDSIWRTSQNHLFSAIN